MRHFALALFALTPATLASAAENWTCSATFKEGWITESYSIEADGNGYLVSDAVIEELNGSPVAAKVKDNGQTLTLSWRLLATDSAGQQAYISYRASIFRAEGNAFSIRATPDGYDNEFASRGVCAPA